MKIIFGTIELVNFRSFNGKHVFSFDRPPGLYFVSGHNEHNPGLGANDVGKTTLFVDAPLWCMTGTITRSTRPAAGVVSWEKEKSFCRVALHFIIDDIGHVIERTRNPNSLLLDGKDVEQMMIDDLLHLNEAQLRRTIFVPQFGDLFLDLRPEAQSQMFTDILHLDIWLRAAKHASDEVVVIDGKIRKAESSIEVNQRMVQQIGEQIVDARIKLNEFEDGVEHQMKEVEDELAKVRKQLSEVK